MKSVTLIVLFFPWINIYISKLLEKEGFWTESQQFKHIFDLMSRPGMLILDHQTSIYMCCFLYGKLKTKSHVKC